MKSKLTSNERVSNLLKRSYDEAFEAKAKGQPVGWATSVFPQELPQAFGLKVCYPENHAAALAAKKQSLELCSVAEEIGYSMDVCAYARTNFGFLEKGGNDVLNIPFPDFLLCCNNICNQTIKWYENISRKLNIPLIMIDTPFNMEDEVSSERVDYMEGQMDEAIKQLESISGKKLDPKRLEKVMGISVDNGRLWKKAMDMTSTNPSPMNGFDLFSYMAAIVCARGREETTLIFETLIEELKERINHGNTTFRGEEKYRIMMEGIPCWPHIGYKMKVLTKYGVNMTGSVYPDAWALEYEANDVRGMAKAYSLMFNNVNLKKMTQYRTKSLIEGKCDGAFYHMNRSCKLMSLLQYEMQRQTQAATGLPSASFDGDQADPRCFTKAQFETRIQALVEVMEERS